MRWLQDEDDKSFGFFLVKIRCKLLKRLAIERGPMPFAGALAPAAVTLVILWNPDPKFNL
jgi:hypothetical protein